MVSFVHGLSALFMSTYQVFVVPNTCNDGATPFEYFVLVNSAGYFLYDMISMGYFKLLDLDMSIHHSLCIGGICAVLSEGHDAGFVVAGLFVAEFSNPAMHCRVMLRSVGKRYTKAYEVAEYCYFAMFFFGRVLAGHPVVYNTVTCTSMHLLGRFVSLGILAQSYLFLYRMWFILNSRLRETSERRQKKIPFYWFEPISASDLEKCKFAKKKT
jgi:hypothetical protein